MSASSLTSWTSASRSSLFDCSSECSSSKFRSKWSSMARLPRPVMMRMSVSPAATASSTTYWIDGLSTTGSISLGWLFVAGRKRVPSPAAGMTAFLTVAPSSLGARRRSRARRYPSARGTLVADIGWFVAFVGLVEGRVARIESQLLALHEPPQVGEVSCDDEQRHHGDHDDVARLVAGEDHRDRERDRHADRGDGRLVRDSRQDDPQ